MKPTLPYPSKFLLLRRTTSQPACLQSGYSICTALKDSVENSPYVQFIFFILREDPIAPSPFICLADDSSQYGRMLIYPILLAKIQH